MKRRIVVWGGVLAVAATFVAGSAGTSEAGLFCCGWLHDLFHHHDRAPVCDPCAPAAVSSYYAPVAYYGPRMRYATAGAFYGAYAPSYYSPAVPACSAGCDACCPSGPVATYDSCGPACAPVCSPCGSGAVCPGGVCPPGTVSGAPSNIRPQPQPEPGLNDVPSYDPPRGAAPPAGAEPPRTFEEEDDRPAPPPGDQFRERGAPAPVNEPIEEEIPIPSRTEAFRPESTDIPTPPLPMPEVEPPVPDRPMSPSELPVNNHDSSGTEPGADRESGKPADVPPAAPLRLEEEKVAWRSVPAPTRTVLHATYSTPEVTRTRPGINDGWSPKPRGPQFVRK